MNKLGRFAFALLLAALALSAPAREPDFREYRFTRSGSDSIQYYYDDGNPYGYGVIHGGGVQPDVRDLCMRVYGVMNPVDSTYWDVGNPALTISV